MTAAILIPLASTTFLAALVYAAYRLDLYLIRRRRARLWRAITDRYAVRRTH